ncbi:MAG TPA: helix-turn-helix transcriptional regulator [Pyrinomonadaceae bacterium]|nr:helix-turn-helix transcriptional regulator [Pyrinomonadaceae bacterium]
MAKERPKRLGKKLAAIRKRLELSQNGMVRRLGLRDKLTREEISAYERGVRQPSLPTLSRYAEIAGIWMDVLVKDDLDLPEKFPSRTKSQGIQRLPKSPAKKSKRQ